MSRTFRPGAAPHPGPLPRGEGRGEGVYARVKHTRRKVPFEIGVYPNTPLPASLPKGSPGAGYIPDGGFTAPR